MSGIVKINPLRSLADQTYGVESKTKEDTWSVPALIEKSKDLPVQVMSMSALNITSLAPIFQTMNDFVAHIQKVQDADMQYPIILDDEGFVMDGRHRIAKALLEGHETIKYVRFGKTPNPCTTNYK